MVYREAVYRGWWYIEVGGISRGGISSFDCICRQTYLARVDTSQGRFDLRHVGRFGDVDLVSHDVDGVLARDGWPVLDVSCTVTVIVTVDLSLTRSFDGETYRRQIS